MALASAAPAATLQPGPLSAVRQALATVRIVNPARVRLGEAATVRSEFTLAATSGRFRDSDGTVHPALLVEFP